MNKSQAHCQINTPPYPWVPPKGSASHHIEAHPMNNATGIRPSLSPLSRKGVYENGSSNVAPIDRLVLGRNPISNSSKALNCSSLGITDIRNGTEALCGLRSGQQSALNVKAVRWHPRYCLSALALYVSVAT